MHVLICVVGLDVVQGGHACMDCVSMCMPEGCLFVGGLISCKRLVLCWVLGAPTTIYT